jgi:putative ABC transport system permease protein
MTHGTIRPPRWAAKILGRLIDPSVRDQAMGDFEEQFRWLAGQKGIPRARFWYDLQMIPVFKSFIINSTSWGAAMFKNYLKTALRNIRKQKGYSFLNISGLALGMACCILIIFYIHHELSYDRFHQNADRIYRVSMQGLLNGEPMNIAVTPNPLAPALRIKFPEVLGAARIRKRGTMPVTFADKEYIESGIIYADPALFEVFSFPLIQGDPKTALERPFSVVLTERTARKYFGTVDPIGKSLKFDNQSDYTITGVLKDIPENFHLKFEMVTSLETFFINSPRLREDWYSDISGYTYIRLSQPEDLAPLAAKLPAFLAEKMGLMAKMMKAKVEFRLQPLTAIHLRSKLQWEFGGNGDILYVYIFAAIALIILAIACVNFMNLATARSARRAREVGMRKVVGAGRGDIFWQFLGESISASLLALVVALVSVRLALPLFKSISGIALTIGIGQLAWLIPVFFGLVLVIGFVAGSYPAVYLSAFQPVKALKGGKGGSNAGTGSARFRRILVVGQFVLSIAMIIGTQIIGDQIRYMKTKDLGFQKDQVLGIRTSDPKIIPSLDQVKSRLKEIPGVLEVSAASRVPGQGESTNGIIPEGSTSISIYRTISADADYLRTMGMTIVRGRDFSKEQPSDVQNSVLLNETAVQKIGWDDPIGKTVKLATGVNSFALKTVVGIVKDFHSVSLRERIEPLLIANEMTNLGTLVVKIKTEEISRLVGELKTAWKTISPGKLFDYFFVDDLFDAKFRSEERLNTIFSSFSFLAIAIACLGLFGLASFMAEQKKKEIGIRKVLGASIVEIVGLLSSQFLKLVGLAALIAWPIAYFAMNAWLREFAYRTSLSPWTFLGSGLAAVMIAFLTVSYQAVRAASADPVDSLKYE